MLYAEKLVAVLVQRLGGRVEISPSELDAMGEDGTMLIAHQPTTEFKYVLEVRRGLRTAEDEAHRQLANFTSPEAKQWKADVVETMARRVAGLPDPTGVLRESYERMQEWADTRQPVEGREHVVNRDQAPAEAPCEAIRIVQVACDYHGEDMTVECPTCRYTARVWLDPQATMPVIPAGAHKLILSVEGPYAPTRRWLEPKQDVEG